MWKTFYCIFCFSPFYHLDRGKRRENGKSAELCNPIECHFFIHFLHIFTNFPIPPKSTKKQGVAPRFALPVFLKIHLLCFLEKSPCPIFLNGTRQGGCLFYNANFAHIFSMNAIKSGERTGIVNHIPLGGAIFLGFILLNGKQSIHKRLPRHSALF